MADEEVQAQDNTNKESPPPVDAAAQADAALNDADRAAEAIAGELDMPQLDKPPGGHEELGIDLLSDVNLKVKIELGRTRMYVEDVLRLNAGSVVELDKPAGDPVDIFVNDRHVARGEVIVVNDNFCVRVSEILSGTPRDD